jgi:hypothetical protein
VAEQLDFETEFQAVLYAEPFAAFTIVVAGGDRFLITDSGNVSTGADVVTIFERHRRTTIRFFNIVSIEVMEPVS